MQIKNYQFKPPVLAVVVTLIAVSVFGYLAIWQLGRAEERKLLREEILQRVALPVSDIADSQPELKNDRYKRYKLKGKFLDSNQLLLDNVVRNGKAGYEVITPFQLTDDGQVLLVNRGWLEAGRDRSVFPDVSVTEDVQEIVASLDKPRSAPVVGAQPVESGMRWNYLDVELYRQQTGMKVPDFLMLLAPEFGQGFDRHWPEIADKSGMHIGYAIQWAAFALIALGTFLGMNIKKRKD